MKIEAQADKILLETQQLIAKRLRELAIRCGKIIQEKVQEAIVDSGAVATGDLVNSITFQVRKKLLQYAVSVYSEGLERPYQIYQNEGTVPHYPPAAEIRKWILDKGQNLHIVLDSESINDDPEKTLNALTYMIVKSIGKKGTKAVHFFDIAVKTAEPIIEAELAKWRLTL